MAQAWWLAAADPTNARLNPAVHRSMDKVSRGTKKTLSYKQKPELPVTRNRRAGDTAVDKLSNMTECLTSG
jgi:hypothetical protein